MSIKLHFLSTGCCTGIENIVLKTGRWKKIRFPALVAWIEHPAKGHILFDTGYSQHVFRAAKKLPYSLYPLITPITFSEEQSAANQLRKKGILPEEVAFVILSHFHADHIGGIKDFNNARFIHTEESYASVKKLKGLSALRKAYLPDLLPNDFEKRSIGVTEANAPLPYNSFPKGFDIFDDGTVYGVPLPGHAIGQMGLIVTQQTGKRIFLAADACWLSEGYRSNTPPNALGKRIIADYPQFLETLDKLHRFHREHPDIPIVPTHCEQALNTLMEELR